MRSPNAGGPQPWLRTIVEQTMPDDQTAVDALVHGEIDVLDRVPPWQVERLRAAKDIRVDSYGLPTVHVLVLNPDQAALEGARVPPRAVLRHPARPHRQASAARRDGGAGLHGAQRSVSGRPVVQRSAALRVQQPARAASVRAAAGGGVGVGGLVESARSDRPGKRRALADCRHWCSRIRPIRSRASPARRFKCNWRRPAFRSSSSSSRPTSCWPARSSTICATRSSPCGNRSPTLARCSEPGGLAGELVQPLSHGDAPRARRSNELERRPREALGNPRHRPPRSAADPALANGELLSPIARRCTGSASRRSRCIRTSIIGASAKIAPLPAAGTDRPLRQRRT